jgi:deltex
MVKSGVQSPKYILNAITPLYSPLNHNEFSSMLYNTFENILKEANYQKDIKSVAIPLLATGNYGAPKDLCSSILLKAIGNFSMSLSHEKSNIKEIQLINLDKEATKQLIRDVEKHLPNSNESDSKNKAEKIEEPNSPGTPSRSKENHNLNEKTERAVFLRLKNEIDQTSTCNICQQRIKLHNLNVLQNCKHRYCFGCTIKLRDNKNKCLLTDQHENEQQLTREKSKKQEHYSNDTISDIENSIREANNSEKDLNEIQAKECTLCCNERDIVYLYKCKHELCIECHKKVFEVSPKCPFCFKLYGKPKGDQPSNGKMTHRKMSSNLPGFPKVGILEITYNIPSGTQQAHHPNPGKPYSGISRVAYLPDNQEGNEILNLLYKSFECGLTFTIGNSRTSNAEGVITWNDIHHKTAIAGSP